ncbi:hypothetical protein H4219_001875 [Mycoemilia scoparia]|uniref:Uncharacterized protein n=1 Tax=Mycoemilia scoparia TaxID=417184 RepID=A0A9W8DV70_9FUNG|nr:hypothetical protein H4219_001875 [Mycoemilia scoparia]
MLVKSIVGFFGLAVLASAAPQNLGGLLNGGAAGGSLNSDEAISMLSANWDQLAGFMNQGISKLKDVDKNLYSDITELFGGELPKEFNQKWLDEVQNNATPSLISKIKEDVEKNTLLPDSVKQVWASLPDALASQSPTGKVEDDDEKDGKSASGSATKKEDEDDKSVSSGASKSVSSGASKSKKESSKSDGDDKESKKSEDGGAASTTMSVSLTALVGSFVAAGVMLF